MDSRPERTSIDRLAREITDLAAHIHAATCRWLGLVAEFDRHDGWGQWGCRSCAEFLSWRCGIAPGAAREHVRVARRLQELPRIRAAFAAGRLSYSKVRALTRVGNVEHEDGLLSLASHSTAAQLERMMRAYRGVVATERAAASRPERYVTWEHADDGSLLLRARLPAEEGAIFVAALDAGVESRRTAADHGDGRAARSADAGVPAETRGASEAAADVPAETSPTLPEQRADALVLMADSLLAGEEAGRSSDRYQVVVHLDAATLAADDAGGRSELADGSPLAVETARRLACDAAIVPLFERGGKPVSVGRKTRSVPPALRRALASRDRGCRFPGCASRSAVDAHHIEPWAHGGATSLDNLVQLCRYHHRLLHEGGYELERTGADFVFRRPDGRALRHSPRPPRGHVAALKDANHRRGPIRPDACVPESHSRMDLGLCVDAMLSYAPPDAPGI